MTPLLLVAAPRLHSPNLLVYEIARSFGLAGFVILAMQPILVARLKWIERPFGMDMLSRFHKSMGIFVTVMMAVSPDFDGIWRRPGSRLQPALVYLGR